MKKFLAIILSLVIVATSGIILSSCSKNQDEKEKTNQNSQEEIVGGFTRADSPEITEEFRKIFEKATEKLTGVQYTPVAYLASQVVAGTNHLVLCKAQAVTPDSSPTYAILKIYEDLEGNAEISEILNSDASAQSTENDGGWAETESPVMPADAKEAIEKACETLTGAEYTPVALLATQVVAGINYRIICESRATVPNAETNYVIVTVYADLNVNAEITETSEFEKESEEQTENSSGDYESELEKLKAKYGIDGTYRENVTEDEDYTEYCYEKVDENGVVNPYDALKVTIDNETGKVFTKKHFDNAAFIEAKIDEKTAERKAAETYPNFSIEKCELEYYMPDYPKGDIILAYRIQFETGYVVYINAVSGKSAGTDQTK